MSLFTPTKPKSELITDWLKYLLIWRLSIFFIPIFALLSIAFYFDDQLTFLAYVIAFVIACISSIYLKVKKRFKPVFFAYATAGTIVLNYTILFILDSPHFVDFQWVMLMIFLAFFGLGVKWGISFLLVNLIPITYFHLFRMNEYIYQLQAQTLTERSLIAIEMASCLMASTYVVYQFIKIQKAAQLELKQKNEELVETNALIQKSNREKTILVKEIHHRVKNNLQIIISLLRLQMTDVKTEESRKHFSEAINRVMVMSSIHQKLYRQEEVTEFELDVYIEELALELKSFFKEEFPIELDIKADYHDIDLKTIVPLGLILNELLSNSFKYAFEQKDAGKISIHIEDGVSSFKMHYSDNGIWKKLKSSGVRGFGSELIEILTEQLNGTKLFKSTSEGTFYTFQLQKITDNE